MATPPGPTGSYDAVIVGGGPRGVATVLRTLARLRAAAGTSEAGGNPTASVHDPSSGRPAPPSAGPSAKRPAPPLRLAMVDALAVGPGATWLIDQPAAYLNNTQARATTIHPDHSTRMSGPAAPGPDLVAWARSVAQRIATLLGVPPETPRVDNDTEPFEPEPFDRDPFHGGR